MWNTRILNRVYQLQREILKDYEENLFVKVNKRAQAKLRECLEVVPSS